MREGESNKEKYREIDRETERESERERWLQNCETAPLKGIRK